MRKSAIIFIVLSLICFLLSSCAEPKPKDNVDTLPINEPNYEANTVTSSLSDAQADAVQPALTNVSDEASLNTVQTEPSAVETVSEVVTTQEEIITTIPQTADVSKATQAPSATVTSAATTTQGQDIEPTYDEDTVEIGDMGQETNQDSIDFSYIEPPRMLIFADYKEYSELINAVELSDEEFNKFIDSMNYSMNGIYQKSDVDKLKEMMNGVPLPIIDGMELSGITIYPDPERDYYTVFYKSENNFSAVFDIRLRKSLDSDIAKKLSASGESYEKVDSNNAEVFCAKDSNNASLIYYVCADGYEMTAVVRNAEKNAADPAFSDIRFEYFPE